MFNQAFYSNISSQNNQMSLNPLNDLSLLNNSSYNAYQLFNTPIKEKFYSSIGISTNKEPTPMNYYDDMYTNNSNIAQKQLQKFFLFNISKAKIDYSSESSIKHYIKNEETPQVENKKFTSPAKKNLFSVFEETLNNNISNNISNSINNNIIKTPVIIRKRKNIFECLSTEKTVFTTSAKKKKRDRKTKVQLQYLNNFYDKNGKKWNRDDIKKISKILSIKETKVYKWLWDRKNKDLKKLKFFISK